jgi:hypothetical protein
MSIYISLVTLEDGDLVHTVNSALSNADNKNDIHIGIAACVSEQFYNKHVLALSYQKQVTAERFDVNQYKGLGKGRKLSRFAYNNEDYILQVDPHTDFKKGWDTFLINEFEAAVNEVGDDKIVLSAYLPAYYQDDTGIVYEKGSTYARYNLFMHSDHRNYSSIRLWSDFPLHEFPEEMQDERFEDRFLPGNKITACFIFGNKHFVEFQGLPENMIFWEEEIVQSIELLSEGFKIVFPNSRMPLYHRYSNSIGTNRLATPDVYNVGDMILISMMTANFYDYIEENGEKCKRYAEYCKYDVESGRVRPFFVPKSYEF